MVKETNHNSAMQKYPRATSKPVHTSDALQNKQRRVTAQSLCSVGLVNSHLRRPAVQNNSGYGASREKINEHFPFNCILLISNFQVEFWVLQKYSWLATEIIGHDLLSQHLLPNLNPYPKLTPRTITLQKEKETGLVWLFLELSKVPEKR